jgi:hypothetical protein
MSQAPEKIHNWLNTQLSIARHYGGLYFMGYQYYIDYIDPEHPLVRSDIFSAEAKARKQTAKVSKAKPKQGDTGSLF